MHITYFGLGINHETKTNIFVIKLYINVKDDNKTIDAGDLAQSLL